jgi:hypothetical protein
MRFEREKVNLMKQLIVVAIFAVSSLGASDRSSGVDHLSNA